MTNGSKNMTITRRITIILMIQLLLVTALASAASDGIDFKENETSRGDASNDVGVADEVDVGKGEAEDIGADEISLDERDQDQDDTDDMGAYLYQYFNHDDLYDNVDDGDEDSSDDQLYLSEDADETDEDDDDDDDGVIQKRNLGVLARKGDIAARRIHMARNYEDQLDDDFGDDYYRALPSNKRHIGSAHVRRHRPRQQEGSYISKRNIAALARKGTLTNLRHQRRPVPSIADDDYYYGAGSGHDGFKRNIHAFSRVTTPGYGFRSWIRGRLSASAAKQQQQGKDGESGVGSKPRNRRVPFIRQPIDDAPFGRVSSTAADRLRGLRSTRLRYFQGGSPMMTSSWSTRPVKSSSRALHGERVGPSASMRAPMAFVSRHHIWKRGTTLASGRRRQIGSPAQNLNESESH